jgi:hypothetical protein
MAGCDCPSLRLLKLLPTDPPNSKPSWLLDMLTKLAGVLATILAIVSAYLFLLGYVALVSYYGVFGLDIKSLDLPTYTFLLYSLLAYKGTVVLLMVLGLSLFLLVMRSSTKANIPGRLWTSLTWSLGASVLLFVSLLPVSSADANGQQAARASEQTAPHAHLTFKTVEKQQYDYRLSKANDEDRLKILTQTKDLVVVFEVEGPRLSTFVVSRSALVSLSIQP